MQLRRAGHPEYIEWSRSFVCNTITQDVLKEVNQEMKTDLKNWLDYVSAQRKSVYVLNHFTCLQLLQISNELYGLINDCEHQISKEIFLLLMNISPDLKIEDIKKVTASTEAKSMCSSHKIFSDNSEEFSSMDLPTEVNKLNDEAKKLFSEYTKEGDFNPFMVLTAIHKFGSDEDEIIDFCTDADNIRLFRNVSSNGKGKDDDKEIKIDVNNPTVQELIKCTYSESLAIDAVKECGEDIASCLEYLADRTLNEADEDETYKGNDALNSEVINYKSQHSNSSSE